MRYDIAYIAAALKKARQEKGWSQRELAQKTGLPQAHISKIENGHVDLQLSSLIQLARVLDLECLLVPRAMVNTIASLQRETKEARPMYRLEEDES